MAALCVTCNEQPAIRLYVGTFDGPYWCSIDCKERWMRPTPADAKEPNGGDACLNAKDDAHGAKVGLMLGMEPEPELTGDALGDALQDAYEKLMRRVG